MRRVDDAAWEEVKRTIRVGDHFEVEVVAQELFGIFVDIPASAVPGLVEIVSLKGRPPGEMPPLGEKLDAVVLGFSEHERQVRLREI